MSKFGESATPRIDPRQLQDFLAVVEHGRVTLTGVVAGDEAKVSAAANSVTSLPRGKIVVKRAAHQISGMIATATQEMIEPS